MPDVNLVITPPAGIGASDLDRVDALRRGFARGPVEVRRESADGFWCRRYRVARQNDWPAGPYRADSPGNAYWLCVDPVHLQVSGDQVMLDAIAGRDLEPDQAHALVTTLNAHFDADGFRFAAATPREWVVRCPAALATSTHAAADVDRRSIEPFLPDGEPGRQLRRIANEAQMLLHDHPVNQAREARRQAAVNGIWLWGGGTLASPTGVPVSEHVWSDALHVRAMAHAAGSDSLPLPTGRDAIGAALSGLSRQGLRAERPLVIDLAPTAAQDWCAWLATEWITPLQVAARGAGWKVRATCVLPALDATCTLFEPDMFRMLRRRSLTWYAATAGPNQPARGAA